MIRDGMVMFCIEASRLAPSGFRDSKLHGKPRLRGPHPTDCGIGGSEWEAICGLL